mmetsp:Transcript_85698/g.134675  ORF Transcript_85698/g.134675 Transcript_85698/m.134675 type:complete len:209 (+) Transcript_85698:32-658(+)
MWACDFASMSKQSYQALAVCCLIVITSGQQGDDSIGSVIPQITDSSGFNINVHVCQDPGPDSNVYSCDGGATEETLVIPVDVHTTLHDLKNEIMARTNILAVEEARPQDLQLYSEQASHLVPDCLTCGSADECNLGCYQIQQSDTTIYCLYSTEIPQLFRKRKRGKHGAAKRHSKSRKKVHQRKKKLAPAHPVAGGSLMRRAQTPAIH